MQRIAKIRIGFLFLLLLVSSCRVRKPKTEDASHVSSEKTTKDAAIVYVAQARQPIKAESPVVVPEVTPSFVELARSLAPSIVHLRIRTNQATNAIISNSVDQYTALGSAFVLDRDGYLATNEHLVRNVSNISTVFSNGNEYPAKIIGRDRKLNIALLKVDAPASILQPLPLGNSQTLEVGQWVLALGNPHGKSIYASAGIISYVNQTPAHASSNFSVNDNNFFHTDAIINTFNTGGPLLDRGGAVIAINSAPRHKSQQNFLIPIHFADRVFRDLREKETVTRSWLGVFIHPLTSKWRKQVGLPKAKGALVSEVIKASPGAKAGILPGDIILRYMGEKIDHHTLPWLASTTVIGEHVAIVVWRGGQEHHLNFIAQEQPKKIIQ